MNRSHHGMAAVAAAGIAALAAAEPTVRFSDGPGNTQGGIFHAATSADGSFDTFCCETGEGLSFSQTYEYTVGTDIIYNGTGSTNPLNAESAFLFTMFVQGQIRAILGKPNLPEDRMADAIQLAIWKIEAMRDTMNVDAMALIAAAQTAIGDGAWSGLGNVRVMNNWNIGHVGDQNYAKQDTLLIVPLPDAAGLAGLSLLGLVAPRRRR